MFLRRLNASIHHNKKLWLSVLDWTVVIYIVIPSIVIGVFLYRDFLMNLPMLTINPTLFLIVLFILSLMFSKSTIRLYLYEADLLFYRQNEYKIRQLKRAALFTEFILFNLFCSFATLLIAPILLAFGFTLMELFKIIVLVNLLSSVQLILHYKIRRIFIRFPIILFVHAIVVASFFHIHVGIYILLLIAMAYLLWQIIQSNRYWNLEIMWEYEAFYKWKKLIYQLNIETRSFLSTKTKPPMLLLAKNRTLSRHRLDNLVYKSILRTSHYITLPLRLLLLGIGLLLILPSWAKIIVILIVTFGLYTALDSILKEIKQAPFFKLMNVAQEDWFLTKARLQNTLVYPAILLLVGFYFIF